jgi:hypothetical protein
MPDEEEIDDDVENDDEDDDEETVLREEDVARSANGQKLVPLPRHRRGPAGPSSERPAPRPATPAPSPARRRRAVKPAPTEPAVMQPAEPLPAQPTPPAPALASPATPASGNVFLAYEETIKLFPNAAQTIAVERKTGMPATWMVTTRPRTANELYAAIKLLHGRREETTYRIIFRDSVGHGSDGDVSMPSTLDELPAPPASAPPYAYAQPPTVPAYAQPHLHPGIAPPLAQPTAPIDAMLAMQKQLLDMMQSPRAAPPAAPAAAPAPPAAPDVHAILAMQKQMFEMVQQMQSASAPAAPAPAPAAPAAPPQDPTSAVLAMQRQLFDMMQQMQAAAAGHQPPPAAVVQPPPAPTPADSTGTLLAMQKQMFDMMLVMMQTAQRAAGPPAPSYGAPRDPGGDRTGPPYGPRSAFQPPQRPQTPQDQLRDAVTMVRSTYEAVRDLGFVGGPAQEPEIAPEEDDTPVRVINMGAAKGVINRSDGSLRGMETLMANLPDIVNWVGKNVAEVRKATAERQERQQQQQQLPPGYVIAGPGYQPPEGFVAVPVCKHGRPVQECPDEGCHGGSSASPQAQTQAPLPEPPDEMPPPITETRSGWGMPHRG